MEGHTECDAVRGTEEAGVLDRRPHERATVVPMHDSPWEPLVSTRLPEKVGAHFFVSFFFFNLSERLIRKSIVINQAV